MGNPTIETVESRSRWRRPEAGADVLELGVPFWDPIADGPVIARASAGAIKGGAGITKALEAARAIRARVAAPLVLFSYYNPLFVRGPARSMEDAARAGVDALLIVDLPPEEGTELRAAAKQHGLPVIPLLSPTTDDDRKARTLAGASGSVYYVSVTGVTGSAEAPLAAARDAAAACRTRGRPACRRRLRDRLTREGAPRRGRSRRGSRRRRRRHGDRQARRGVGRHGRRDRERRDAGAISARRAGPGMRIARHARAASRLCHPVPRVDHDGVCAHRATVERGAARACRRADDLRGRDARGRDRHRTPGRPAARRSTASRSRSAARRRIGPVRVSHHYVSFEAGEDESPTLAIAVRGEGVLPTTPLPERVRLVFQPLWERSGPAKGTKSFRTHVAAKETIATRADVVRATPGGRAAVRLGCWRWWRAGAATRPACASS